MAANPVIKFVGMSARSIPNRLGHTFGALQAPAALRDPKGKNFADFLGSRRWDSYILF